MLSLIEESAFAIDEVYAANARHDRQYGWSSKAPAGYTNPFRLPEYDHACPDHNEDASKIWAWHRRKEGLPDATIAASNGSAELLFSSRPRRWWGRKKGVDL